VSADNPIEAVAASRIDRPTIVVATHNDHKVPEMISALQLPDRDFVSLKDLQIYEEAVESGTDFSANAWIKAGFAFARTKLTCIADDSGIEVDALGGAPGVFSARYAGEDATDEENVAKLLSALQGVPDERRKARFVCDIAMINQDGSQFAAHGSCEGRIAHSPKGTGGFGYDPVFIPDEPHDGRTMAELSADEKNSISHRGRALAELRRKIVSHPGRFEEGPSGECNTALGQQADNPPQGKTLLAVFDFDGTLLDGASPVRLVRSLMARGIMPFSTGLKVARWAMRYKMRLPVRQEEVRGYVFNSLSALSADEVHDLMVELYRSELKPLLKEEGLATIEAVRNEGKRIALVSASFRPIINEIARDLQTDFFVCTEMEIKNGFYTGNVANKPPEGIQKLLQLREKADELYGEGNWILDKAYGDHFSDLHILSASINPFAVDPDGRLKALANRLDWHVLDWQ